MAVKYTSLAVQLDEYSVRRMPKMHSISKQINLDTK